MLRPPGPWIVKGDRRCVFSSDRGVPSLPCSRSCVHGSSKDLPQGFDPRSAPSPAPATAWTRASTAPTTPTKAPAAARRSSCAARCPARWRAAARRRRRRYLRDLTVAVGRPGPGQGPPAGDPDAVAQRRAAGRRRNGWRRSAASSRCAPRGGGRDPPAEGAGPGLPTLTVRRFLPRKHGKTRKKVGRRSEEEKALDVVPVLPYLSCVPWAKLFCLY